MRERERVCVCVCIVVVVCFVGFVLFVFLGECARRKKGPTPTLSPIMFKRLCQFLRVEVWAKVREVINQKPVSETKEKG